MKLVNAGVPWVGTSRPMATVGGGCSGRLGWPATQYCEPDDVGDVHCKQEDHDDGNGSNQSEILPDLQRQHTDNDRRKTHQYKVQYSTAYCHRTSYLLLSSPDAGMISDPSRLHPPRIEHEHSVCHRAEPPNRRKPRWPSWDGPRKADFWRAVEIRIGPHIISPQQMALPAGTRLGPYEVLASIGAGGMGEVYRPKNQP